ncbi:MAG: HNH endonuclease [Gammaproteobacteria bacterium]|nr:HNH endonuclease [Gammaproteobacteria bacterium]
MLCHVDKHEPTRQNLNQQVLRTDVSGMPLEWINYQEAVRLICLDRIAYSLGGIIYTLHGGINALTGLQSTLDVNAILATSGQHPVSHLFAKGYTPPLSNRALFRRDQNICLYCGQQFLDRDLSRDHVKPVSQGGRDIWANVVTSCKRCNNHKAGHTPEQAGIQLLAIPFVPTHAEFVYLQGRRILADQMDFLLSHFPRNSRLRQRLELQRQSIGTS